MIDKVKVFIDTAPFIYFFEGDTEYSTIARDMFLKFINNNIEMLTSYISEVEMKVLPKRYNQLKKMINMDNFIEEFSISKISLYKKVYDLALEIRSAYSSIKLIDAFQLAIGIDTGCDYFVTNDYELKKYNQIKVILMDEYSRILTK